MYYCDSCGATFETPKLLKESHGMAGPPYEEVPVCPRCREPMLVKMVRCSCCNEWTPRKYIATDDGRIYCENCFHWEEPQW